MNRAFVLAIAVSLLTGCGPEAVLGRVRAVEAPDTVEVGQSFVVTVKTSGPDGCWRKDRTEVSVKGSTATITPYDVDTGGGYGAVCTQAVVEIAHSADVTFAAVGPASLRVRGRDGTDQELGIIVARAVFRSEASDR